MLMPTPRAFLAGEPLGVHQPLTKQQRPSRTLLEVRHHQEQHLLLSRAASCRVPERPALPTPLPTLATPPIPPPTNLPSPARSGLIRSTATGTTDLGSRMKSASAKRIWATPVICNTSWQSYALLSPSCCMCSGGAVWLLSLASAAELCTP